MGGLKVGARQPAATSQVPSSSPSSKMASTSSSSPFASVVSPLTNVYDRFSRWRLSLGLPNPGTVENLTKEVKCELRFPCMYHALRPTPLPPRDTSSHTSYTFAFRTTSRLNTALLQPPTSQISSLMVPGPISRKTSRFRRCSKLHTLSRWLRRRHLQHITLAPCLRTTR